MLACKPLTLTGDVNSIEIGKNTNIQDNAIVHVARHNISGTPCKTIIGNNVTIGESSWASKKGPTALTV